MFYYLRSLFSRGFWAKKMTSFFKAFQDADPFYDFGSDRREILLEWLESQCDESMTIDFETKKTKR